MAIHRANPDYPTYSVTDVRIYLDDVEALTKMLAADGAVAMRLNRQRGTPDSRFDDVDDLFGRADVSGIRVSTQKAEVDIGPFEIGAGVHRSAGVSIDDVRHFLDTLERFKRSWYSRNFFPHHTVVDLVLRRRPEAFELREQRRHNWRLALWGGLGGAIIGSAATLVGTLLAAH